MPLPHFLIIGAMKAGTTSLFMDLSANPGVYIPPVKEPHNLCDDRVLTPEGRREYESLYAAARPGQLCGDASTGYSKRPTHEGVAERAVEVLGPELKVIYLVRNPLHRIESHHHHEWSAGEVGKDIDEAVRNDPRFIDYSRYAWQLEPWLERLGAERVRVVRFEDYIADRGGVVADLSRYLGLEPMLEGVRAGVAYNKSEGKAIHRGVWSWVYYSRAYRSLVRPLLPAGFKRWFFDSFLPKSPDRPKAANEATRAEIVSRLTEDLQRLKVLMGRGAPLWRDLQSKESSHSPNGVTTPSSSTASADCGGP